MPSSHLLNRAVENVGGRLNFRLNANKAGTTADLHQAQVWDPVVHPSHTKFHLCILGQQYILALDVPVNHMMDVKMCQSLNKRKTDLNFSSLLLLSK